MTLIPGFPRHPPPFLFVTCVSCSSYALAVYYAPVNVNPRTPRPGYSGAFAGNFRYLTSERVAGIADFDLFCTSSKNSGGVDRGIFHRGGLGQQSLVRQDGGFWP